MELFDASIYTKRDVELPDDLLEALHVREITKAGMLVSREEQEQVHFHNIYESNINYDYETGAKDFTMARDAVAEEKRLLALGKQYFEQGWRLHQTQRSSVTAPTNEVPDDAVCWRTITSGYLGTVAAFRMQYVVMKP